MKIKMGLLRRLVWLAVALVIAWVPLSAKVRVIHIAGEGERCERGDTLFVCGAVDGLRLAEELQRVAEEVLRVAEQGSRLAGEGYSPERPLTVEFEPGVYWIDDPYDPEVRYPEPGESIPYGLKLRLNNVRFVGLSDSPEDVVLACDRGQTMGAYGNFTMFHFTGDDVSFENLTLGNFCNVDLEYPRDPSLNRPRRAKPIVQAQLAICDGDRYMARNCRFISRLNLCPLAGAKRALFDNCYFECTDDALCGSGVYLGCRFLFFSSKPFYRTDGDGAVFLNCDIETHTHGRQYLTKVGSPVAMVDCRWKSEDDNLKIDWTPYPSESLKCYKHNLTLNGAPLTIGGGVPNSVDMSGKDILSAYKFGGEYNVCNLVGGYDGWNPLAQDTSILRKIPVCLRLNEADVTLRSESDTLRLTASSPVRSWVTDCDGLNIVFQDDNECMVVGINESDDLQSGVVTAVTAEGLEAACSVTVEPPVLPAPSLLSKPQLIRGKDSYELEYQLGLDGREDRSLITWHRCKAADGSDGIPVAVTRGRAPLRRYSVTAADRGWRIMAVIRPKHVRSNPGEPVRVISEEIPDVKVAEMVNETDFSSFPTDCQPNIIPGFWTVDAFKPEDTAPYDWTPDSSNAWFYGNGFDAARESEGLVPQSRGARLMYQPVNGADGEMIVELDVDPCKSAGQGFGSATGQYMDVCLKYDPETLTGYGLRIMRTVKNDKAVDFQLMKFEGGKAEPISEAVSATCFRVGCMIRIEFGKGRLNAVVINDKFRNDRADLPSEVRLEAAAEENGFGGFSLQHTGSTGASACVLKRLRIEWE